MDSRARSRIGHCTLAAAIAAGLLAACEYKFSFDSGGVTPPVVIVRPPQSTTVTVGQPARFDATTSGGGKLAWQWQRNGQPIAGATSTSYVTPPATADDDGSLFTVTVCDETSCVNSLPALLTVLRGP